MKLLCQKNLFECSLVILIISGFAYLFSQRYERIIFILFIGMVILSIQKVVLKERMKKPHFIDFIHTAFIVTFVIDGIVYLNYRPFIYGFSMEALYRITRNTMLHSCKNKIYDKLCQLSVLLSICIILFSVYKAKPTFSNYYGCMANPNTFGIFAASLFTIMISYIASNLINYKKITFIEIAIFMCSAFLVYISSCRSAFAALILQIGFMMFLRRKRGIALDITFKVLYGAIFIALFGVLFIKVSRVWTGINMGSIFEKTMQLVHQGDISNGRFDIWKSVWESKTLFWDGSLRYNTITHNVYLGLINSYGLVNGILYFIFIIFVFIRSIQFAFSSYAGRWKYLPLMSTILFISVSMNENYLMTTPMILVYICIPLILSNPDSCILEESQKSCSFIPILFRHS